MLCCAVVCCLVLYFACYPILKDTYNMATQDPLASLEGDMLDVAPGVKPVDGDVKATEHVERLANVETNSTDKNGSASNGEVQECDVLVVGAGFSGEYMLSDTTLWAPMLMVDQALPPSIDFESKD